MKIPAILLLQDGTVFYGNAAGKIGTTTGEICFNTGMTGYQEIFTDPSYYGQLMVMTSVHIGNYGTKNTDVESANVKIAGLITRNFNVEYSRPLADQNIQVYAENENLVGITDVDTRSIVRHIRTKGAMNGIISSEVTDVEVLKKMLSEVPSMAGLELATQVSTKEAYTLGNPEAKYRVAVLDFGVKQSILTNFTHRDCFLKVFPAKTSFDKLREFKPDGYFLSNGPGDPEPLDFAIETTKKILKKEKPLFGICLGHQILALSMGVPTYKMHHGHRGINHPVKNLMTGLGEITSQNHGFAVSPEGLKKKAADIEITHINLNDDTIEGFRLKHTPAFSVQYHPEASPGPHDARYLFDDFIKML